MNSGRIFSLRTAIAAVATVCAVAAVGLILFKPWAQRGFEVAAAKPVGRYCLIKPGKHRTHCEGEDTGPRDPVLAAIKTVTQQGAALMPPLTTRIVLPALYPTQPEEPL